jgi:hypothetical protein
MKNNKLVQINEGEYYLFFNFYKGSENITLGFPYKNSSRNDVYLGVNGEEQGRISYSEANKYLSKSLLSILPIHRIKGISSNTLISSTKQIENQVKCKLCDKLLRGNLSKVFCTECYQRLGRPEIQKLENFRKLNGTYFKTLDLAFNNYTVEEISHERELSFTTILIHLEKLSQFVSFNNHDNLHPDPNIVFEVNRVVGLAGRDQPLSVFYEQLNKGEFEEFSFEEIRHALFYIDFCN